MSLFLFLQFEIFRNVGTHSGFGDAIGGWRNAITAARLKRAGTEPGWPDLQFAGPGAQMAFLELKRRGSGRLSESQAAMRDHLEGCGFAYLCTDDVAAAISWLQARGILRGAKVLIG